MEGGIVSMDESKIELLDEDVKIADYIYSILKFQKTILMSWGFQRPMVIKLGLKFTVNGFKHKGMVQVKYNEGADLFDIFLIDKDDMVKETIEGVYFDELVNTIDNHVELVPNYNERINQEYNILTGEEEVI